MSTLTKTADAREIVGTWRLDPAHSRVAFSIAYMAGTFHGSFSSFDATLEAGSDGSAQLAGAARVESVQVQDENLGTHLLSPEFFDAERAPEVTFRSSAFEAKGDHVFVEGELAIRGIMRPIRLEGTIGGPVVDPYGRPRINLSLATVVDRSDFGLDWNVDLPSVSPPRSP
jgi:polyisoprenoid-binding protein YceI